MEQVQCTRCFRGGQRRGGIVIGGGCPWRGLRFKPSYIPCYPTNDPRLGTRPCGRSPGGRVPLSEADMLPNRPREKESAGRAAWRRDRLTLSGVSIRAFGRPALTGPSSLVAANPRRFRTPATGPGCRRDLRQSSGRPRCAWPECERLTPAIPAASASRARPHPRRSARSGPSRTAPVTPDLPRRQRGFSRPASACGCGRPGAAAR